MHEPWQRAPSQQDPYVRWGETVFIDFGGLGQQGQQREFQRIELPRPTLCKLAINYWAIPKDATSGVDYSAITYSTGIGSSNARTRRVFITQPQVGQFNGAPANLQAQEFGTPLFAEWDVTVQSLYAQAEAQAVDCLVYFNLSLTPVALESLR